MPASISTSDHDLRRHLRVPVTERITIAWTDPSGINRVIHGACANASQSGAGLELRDPLDARGYINFRCERLKLNGTGSVRYCVRKGRTWVAGIEFSGGLAWRPSA